MNKTAKRWYDYYETLAPKYKGYYKRFSYYWNDSIKYFNYFITEDQSILQIGCGHGETLAKIKGSKKTGVDFSPALIVIAKESFPDIQFELMDAHELRLKDQYDVIILSNVVGCFDNVLEVLKLVRKVSHERTKVFITGYNRVWQPILKIGELFGVKKRSPEQNWLGKGDIENLAYLAGFEVFRTNRRVLLPIYIPLISTLFNKYIARLPLINIFCLNQLVVARIAERSSEVEYSVSVVIPARNESGNIERAIKETPKLGSHTEIIFVEGNSTDDTWEEVQRIEKKYRDSHDIKITQQPGKGKYDAVKHGYAMASGDIMMILDGDLTVPPEDLTKFYDALTSGKGDFINGSRLVYPMEDEAMRFLNMLGNKFFSYVFSWLLDQPIKDTLCGTKVMFREDYEKLAANRKFFGDFDPFGDFDLLFGSYKLNLKIIDLPIRYRDRTYGDTNISRFRHGMILIRMVLFAMNKIKFS